MNCWGQAFTASIIVGLIIIAAFALFLWAMVEYVKNYLAKLATKVVDFGTSLFRYFNALIIYLSNQSTPNLDALKKEIENVITVLSSYFNLNSKKSGELRELFDTKTDQYLSGDKKLLSKTNDKIADILGKSREKMDSVLDKVDDFVLTKPTNSATLYSVLQNLNALLSK